VPPLLPRGHFDAMLHGAPAAAWAPLSLALGLAAVGLQGCDSPIELRQVRKQRSRLEICPEALFGDGGVVTESYAGDVVDVHCPAGQVYVGPAIECSWVDRFCIAFDPARVNPHFCYNEYNLTLRGGGLTAWPGGVFPILVQPPPADGNGGIVNGSGPSGAGGFTSEATGRRLGHDRQALLPRIVAPEELLCHEEAYTDLNFDRAGVSPNNLGGLGPDAGREGMLFTGVSTFEGQEVDLLVNASASYTPGKVERNGKGSLVGRININSTGPVQLTFALLKSGTQDPMTLPKVFFTLFDVSARGAGGDDLEIVAEGVSEYFVSEQTLVAVRTNGSRCIFGPAEDPPAPLDPSKAGVKDMRLDSVNRSVLLVYRNTSEFALDVKARPGPAGRDFEFAGWSEAAEIGKRAVCAGGEGH